MNKTTRERTRPVHVGSVQIGGQDKVVIQSMCSIKTSRVKEVADQINRCAALGAELMRVSVLDMEDAAAIGEIVKLAKVPIIADIHFDYRLALAAINHGVSAVRLNPGNIGGPDKVAAVVALCKEKNVPIRVGVNSGSLPKELDLPGKANAEELVKAAEKMVRVLEDLDFHDIILSLKGSDVRETIGAYELASEKFAYPLHLGITEAGPKDVGLIRSAAGLAPLLLDGLGDTIRISLSDAPEEEVLAARRLLKDLGLNEDWPNLVSCPTCGRTAVDLLPLANRMRKFLEENKIPLTVAVMGCIVNGPGEARKADIGVAGAKGVWVMFKKGVRYKVVKDEDVYQELTDEILRMAGRKA